MCTLADRRALVRRIELVRAPMLTGVRGTAVNTWSDSSGPKWATLGVSLSAADDRLTSPARRGLVDAVSTPCLMRASVVAGDTDLLVVPVATGPGVDPCYPPTSVHCIGVQPRKFTGLPQE